MDIENAVISSIINNGSVVEAISCGVDRELFVGKSRLVWDWLAQHYTQYGETPGVHALTARWDDYELVETTETTRFYVDKLREARQIGILREHYVGAGKMLNAKAPPAEAVQSLREALIRIDNLGGELEDLDYRTTRLDRHQRYLRTKEAGGVEGLRFPFPTLSHQTGGLKDEDFVILVAYTGVGKTWFLVMCAIEAARNSGRAVNFHSNEMPDWQIGRRIDAIVHKLPYGDLVAGELTMHDEARWLKNLDITDDPDIPDIKIFGAEGAGWPYVDAKADLYNPAAVFIDGAYIMESTAHGESQWQRVGAIGRMGKSFAKRRKIPTMASFQLTEDGKIALYRGLDQWADLIIELRQTPDQKLADVMEVIVRKMREGEGMAAITLRWDFRNMEFHEVDVNRERATRPESDHAEY